MRARVILLAGPSGAGKSRLASRVGLPILPLDDYYKDGDDPTLPRFGDGSVDWDDVKSWSADAASAGVRELAETGRTDVPRYDISANSRVGHRSLTLGDATLFVAEGIFAAEIGEPCREAELLALAICVRRSRWVTFVLRLTRDLREHRKPPLVLIKRGWWLTRREPEIVADLVRRGLTPMTPREAERAIAQLKAAASTQQP